MKDTNTPSYLKNILQDESKSKLPLELQQRIDPMNSFISHLESFYNLNKFKDDIYILKKSWRSDLLFINLYLLNLEMTHSNSDVLNEKNNNIKALIQGLQFFVVNLINYKELPTLPVVIKTFQDCLETIESKTSDGQINLTSSLLKAHRNFIKYLNNVPELQKALDEVVAQIKSEEKSLISHDRLQSLKARQSKILELLYPSNFAAPNLFINLPKLAQLESNQPPENNTPPDSPLFFF